MEKITLKVARIGNSRGVRLPAGTLERLGIGDSVIMEEQEGAILLRPTGTGPAKLSWAETAAAMADCREDWSGWDSTLHDGLEGLTWDEPKVKRVAESKSKYQASSAKSPKPKPNRAK